MMKVLFLIPARGGSKGLPGKNLASLGGIHLVGHAARLGRRAARALGSPCRVICSTDDAAIAEAACAWGAEVPFIRPKGLASDDAATNDVVLHALDAVGETFDVLVLLQPTSPLTEVEDVLGAVTLHRDSASPIVSVCPAEHPTEWLFRLGNAGRLERIAEGNSPHQRQAMGTAFRPNGAVYVTGPASFRMARSFFTAETRAFVMPAVRSIDIDTQADLEMARAMIGARQTRPVRMLGRAIGDGSPCFVIAEAGVNHNGDIDLARRLVDVAASAGADAVKFQSFHSEKVISRGTPLAEYQARNTGSSGSMIDMVKGLELSADDHQILVEHARERGITFLSTPFDAESADLLADLGVSAFKLASGEVTNHELLRHVAGKGKPVILSTGMSTLLEVAEAVDVLEEAGCQSLALLQCVSNYPADPADVNLRAIRTMEQSFRWPAGYSDHTLGNEVAFAAVAAGAHIIEKHFTLDRNFPGPDHKASAEPEELAALVRGIRSIESAMGTGEKRPAESEKNTAAVARRSLAAARDIQRGEIMTRSAIALLRPGTGIPPSRRDQLVGRRARVAIQSGAMLSEEMFE